MGARVPVEIDGRTLSLSNLDKVLYPDVGFTKAQVIDYYARIAPVMLPHLQGRCITLRRWPDGVEGPSFFEKNCPKHRPEWIGTALGPGDRKGGIHYCCLDEPAALAWTANMAALELHVPMARAETLDHPTMLVFDLDPGAPATIVECCQIAMLLREVLESVGLVGFAKTSGSKGMQVYVPLNTDGADVHTHEHVAGFALAVGQLLTKQHPDRVLVNMKRAERPGKIFVDWSQNAHHKTTIGVYSMRAKSTPTVSTPITWDEVANGADGPALSLEAGDVVLSFTSDDVLGRVEEFGDLFAPTLELRQELPTGQ